eukprot:1033688-Prorocentrum_minimum.AAC.1
MEGVLRAEHASTAANSCTPKDNSTQRPLYENEGVWSYVVTGKAVVLKQSVSSAGANGDSDDGDGDDDGLGTWGIVGISVG